MQTETSTGNRKRSLANRLEADKLHHKQMDYLESIWAGSGWMPDDVRKVSSPDQKNLVSTLASITKLALKQHIRPPSLWDADHSDGHLRRAVMKGPNPPRLTHQIAFQVLQAMKNSDNNLNTPKLELVKSDIVPATTPKKISSSRPARVQTRSKSNIEVPLPPSPKIQSISEPDTKRTSSSTKSNVSHDDAESLSVVRLATVNKHKPSPKTARSASTASSPLRTTTRANRKAPTVTRRETPKSERDDPKACNLAPSHPPTAPMATVEDCDSLPSGETASHNCINVVLDTPEPPRSAEDMSDTYSMSPDPVFTDKARYTASSFSAPSEDAMEDIQIKVPSLEPGPSAPSDEKQQPANHLTTKRKRDTPSISIASDSQSPSPATKKCTTGFTGLTAERIYTQLTTDAMLTDDVLDLLCEVTVQKHGGKGNVYAVDPLWFKQNDTHLPSDLRWLKEGQIACFPVHDFGSKHWSLAVVRILPGVIRVNYHDSLQSDERAQTFKTCFQAWMDKTKRQQELHFNPQICPRQEDGTSCGVFCLTCLEYDLRSVKCPAAVDHELARAELLSTLRAADKSHLGPVFASVLGDLDAMLDAEAKDEGEGRAVDGLPTGDNSVVRDEIPTGDNMAVDGLQTEASSASEKVSPTPPSDLMSFVTRQGDEASHPRGTHSTPPTSVEQFSSASEREVAESHERIDPLLSLLSKVTFEELQSRLCNAESLVDKLTHELRVAEANMDAWSFKIRTVSELYHHVGDSVKARGIDISRDNIDNVLTPRPVGFQELLRKSGDCGQALLKAGYVQSVKDTQESTQGFVTELHNRMEETKVEMSQKEADIEELKSQIEMLAPICEAKKHLLGVSGPKYVGFLGAMVGA
ncbi:hypothetical protein FZEAL_2147 [Fusarium zealandicum]|uniref:Ubiquitin-like protease family profile domain-containing protein n=1 Tax=Fusarium zealandicum TaxID=1053134 RepID=A0A8H4URG6_9HYPO|nr:hypothetical protein FZEAL_2147 [Fusarium zealandicum]